jgi:hypothetical protein
MGGALQADCLTQGMKGLAPLRRRDPASIVHRRRWTPHALRRRSSAGEIVAVMSTAQTGYAHGTAAGKALMPPTPITSLQQLPAKLRSNVALLEAPNAAAAGGITRVFVLAVSHVSRVSCDQVCIGQHGLPLSTCQSCCWGLQALACSYHVSPVRVGCST